METKLSLAEQFRKEHCEQFDVNGFSSECWNISPGDCGAHLINHEYDGTGFKFPDNSEIWSSSHGTTNTINTVNY
jgi:hypothetical protein